MIVRRMMLPSACIAAAVLGACAPEAVTTEGRDVNRLYDIFLGVAAVVFALTGGLIAWSLIRYRARDDEMPKQIHANTALEIVWFAIPQVIVVVLFVLTATTLNTINAEAPERDTTTIEVTGYQWGWRFEYPGGATVRGTPQEPARVVIPTGNVTFVMTSVDVVHAFYVPRFLIKRDVIPGRETRIDVEVTEPGTYSGYCAEFCGLLHDRMTFTVEAVPPDEFGAWLDEAGS